MAVKQTVLIVDDEKSARFFLDMHLVQWGYATLQAASGAEALQILDEHNVDIILSDQVMPNMDGLQLLTRVREEKGDIPFVVITAHGSIGDAVAYLKEGANDYILKPINVEELKATIKRCLHIGRLSEENRKLKDQLRGQFSFHNIVTRSARMREVLRLCEKVAQAPNTTVALFGESGVGKEVLARAIHFSGDRLENRFVAINCAGIPSGLLESELFGHEKGAFTGAERAREGKFEAARGGTLLLDEIGDMPIELQAKLLRVLQERTFEKVGSNRPVKVDFRVIVSTNKDLQKMVAEGRFREDLYHRITAFPIQIPPLRERPDDIPLLVEYFLLALQEELGKRLPPVSDEAMSLLCRYAWPGNIRELRNSIERAAIIAEGDVIGPELFGGLDGCKHLPAAGILPRVTEGEWRMELRVPEEELSLRLLTDQILDHVLSKCDQNKSLAAQKLKIDRKMFYRRSGE